MQRPSAIARPPCAWPAPARVLLLACSTTRPWINQPMRAAVPRPCLV